MKAIVIAAGLGNRLGELTEDKPKALVQVDGRELILRVMDFLDAGNFSERIVITGYKSEIFTEFLKTNCPDVRILHNPNFEVGSIKTIEAALPHMDDEFLLMNADHIYPKRMLTSILEKKAGLMAICDFDRDLGNDDMKIKLDSKRRIASISKKLTDFDCGYIGMTFCSKEMLETYRTAIKRTLDNHGEIANVEVILGQLASEKTGIDIFDASGIGWLEIDTRDDLDSAARVLQDNPGFLS